MSEITSLGRAVDGFGALGGHRDDVVGGGGAAGLVFDGVVAPFADLGGGKGYGDGPVDSDYPVPALAV